VLPFCALLDWLTFCRSAFLPPLRYTGWRGKEREAAMGMVTYARGAVRRAILLTVRDRPLIAWVALYLALQAADLLTTYAGLASSGAVELVPTYALAFQASFAVGVAVKGAFVLAVLCWLVFTRRYWRALAFAEVVTLCAFFAWVVAGNLGWVPQVFTV
jgi:uncharacterized protein DUF5658